ncbi:LOW QUALITY PROTEIN: hypothetical protein CsatB_015774 [Cannabis sativa]
MCLHHRSRVADHLRLFSECQTLLLLETHSWIMSFLITKAATLDTPRTLSSPTFLIKLERRLEKKQKQKIAGRDVYLKFLPQVIALLSLEQLCREDALKPNTNALCRYLFLNSLCTNSDSTQLTESLELPSWVKAVVPSKTSTDEDDNEEDDDFVIPSLAHWVESPSRKLVVELEAREQLFNKTIESDIDKLSNVLNKRYASPKKVAQELDGCGDLNLSGSFDLGTQTGYRHSPESYNLMVDILGKADEFQHMWELIEVMSSLDGYISLVTMAEVIRRLARAHLYEEVIAAFKGMERLGISKDVSGLNILLDKLVKENSVEHAQEVFLEFRDCEYHKFQHFSTWVVQS